MTVKQIDVTCPCCDTHLVVDVLTQKVLKHTRPEHMDPSGRPKATDERWDAANRKVADRQGRAGQDRFDAALGREQEREKNLDDLFKEAQDRLEKRKKDLDG